MLDYTPNPADEEAALDRLQADNDELRARIARFKTRLIGGGYQGRHEPTPEERRSAFTVIKGGMAAFAAPFVVLGHVARDHVVAAAAAVAIPVAAGGALVVVEAPPVPAGAGHVAEAETVQQTVGVPAFASQSPGRAAPPGQPPVPDPAGPALRGHEQVTLELVREERNPTGERNLVEASARSASDDQPWGAQTLPMPTPSPQPVATSLPAPEPTPTPTATAEAVLACLYAAAGGGLPECAGLGSG